MATPKQQKLINLLIENYGNPDTKTLGELMLEAGYSVNSAKNPQLIIQGKEVQEGLSSVADDLAFLRQKAIDELKARNIDSEPYRDVVRAVESFTKNHQLLSGGETERSGVTINVVKYSDKT